MPLPNSGNSHVVLSHLVIIDALCNKIVSLSHKKAVALFNNRPSHFIITLEHFVINLKWMVGGQLIPTISHHHQPPKTKAELPYHLNSPVASEKYVTLDNRVGP